MQRILKNPGNTFCVVCFDIEKVNGRLIVNINRKEQKRISNEVEEEQCFVENAEPKMTTMQSFARAAVRS